MLNNGKVSLPLKSPHHPPNSSAFPRSDPPTAPPPLPQTRPLPRLPSPQTRPLPCLPPPSDPPTAPPPSPQTRPAEASKQAGSFPPAPQVEKGLQHLGKDPLTRLAQLGSDTRSEQCNQGPTQLPAEPSPENYQDPAPRHAQPPRGLAQSLGTLLFSDGRGPLGVWQGSGKGE